MLVGAAVTRLRNQRGLGLSLRRSAHAQGIARTSLRRAEKRLDALLLVVVLQCGAGVERVQFILRVLRLHTRIACSRSHLQERAREMGDKVREFGVEQTVALSATMPPRTVTLCPDEMWMAGTMVLVANEPVSGWLWVQKIAATRDRATWTEAVQEGTRGMSLTIRTVNADCASGLIAMAVSSLGVSHDADLFHGQYELTRTYSRRLTVRVATAEKAHQEAVETTRTLRAGRRAAARGERGPGRPPDWEHHLAVAEHAQHRTEAALRGARSDQATMGEVVRGLSEALHPVDLATGEPREGDAVVRSLDALVARARGVAEKLGELIEYLVATMPLPALPRQRTVRVVSAIERLNL